MSASDAAWQQAVRDYWFALAPEQWFGGSAIDGEIRTRFGDVWAREQHRHPHDFLRSGDAALAAILLFDQFPRNMHRGTRQAFATDALARTIAGGAIERGYDRAMTTDQRAFVYLPFEHSEAMADQERSLRLFGQLGDADYLRFAETHHAMIARFGRFPSRNAALGRTSTPEEAAAGDPEPF